jgi:hypothetical protein
MEKGNEQPARDQEIPGEIDLEPVEVAVLAGKRNEAGGVSLRPPPANHKKKRERE